MCARRCTGRHAQEVRAWQWPSVPLERGRRRAGCNGIGRQRRKEQLMSCEVYANGMSIACKAADGKTVAAFPDVCFTPPLTPATPPGVPIPYPNTGMASDTSGGSKTVKISDQEVMLKNSSYFQKSMGDEAGCAPKKGVLTSKNMGKIYFNAWSMDVKIEGENA